MDIAIIGGGASGLSAAITIKKNKDYNVTIFERLKKPGSKIKASGAGRGNLSNEKMDPYKFNHPFFAKKVVDMVNVEDLKEFFLELGIVTKKDKDGRIYPYNEEASSVAELLRIKAINLGVEIKTNKKIEEIIYRNNRFYIDGKWYDKAILATGGKSYESLGSDGSGYLLAKSLGHSITSIYPGLTGYFTKEKFEGLDGIRSKVSVRIDDFFETGEILFRNDSISGIVIFDVTSYIGRNKINNPKIFVDFLPDYSYNEAFELITRLQNSNGFLYLDTFLLGVIDQKIYLEILNKSNIDYKKRTSSSLTTIEITKLLTLLKSYPIELTNPYSFDKSQVSIGGVRIDEVNSSFESLKISGLYIIGELLDIDGLTGGYNMHMAFASGIIAGLDVIKC